MVTMNLSVEKNNTNHNFFKIPINDQVYLKLKKEENNIPKEIAKSILKKLNYDKK
jgi:hypothetical protein